VSPRAWWARQQAADYSGYNVRTIDRAFRSGALRYEGLPRHRRTCKEWVDQWVKGRRS
jgi:hypothetical protein